MSSTPRRSTRAASKAASANISAILTPKTSQKKTASPPVLDSVPASALKSSKKETPGSSSSCCVSTFKFLAIFVALVAVVVKFVPGELVVHHLVHPGYRLDRPALPPPVEVLSGGGTYDDFLPEISVTVGKRGYPVIVRPESDAAKNFSNEELAAFASTNLEWLTAKLHKHGAVLFRGFTKGAVTAPDFERVVMKLEPALEKEYLGMSERPLIDGCRFVRVTSQYAGTDIISAHPEMSFMPEPPKKIFFFAREPNQPPGGETPVTDLLQVTRDMDPEVLNRFKQKRIKYLRSVYDQDEGMTGVLQSKSWQSMFSTTDPAVAEAKCDEKGFTWEWANKEERNGALIITHTMNATRIHPTTGEDIWHNHLMVYHDSTIFSEYAFSAQHLHSWDMLIRHWIGGFLRWCSMQRANQPRVWSMIGQGAVHEGDEQMLQSDVDHVRHLVWKNTIGYSHQKGDIVMLDNRRMAHGRQPFSGYRSILVTWA